MILKDLNVFIGKNDEQLLLDGYNGLNENKNNFSYWFPKIKDCGIEIPKTFYAKVPIEVYKELLLSLDDNDLKLNNLQNFLSEITDKAIKDGFAYNSKVFVKNAVFSNKFDFSNSCKTYLNKDELLKSILQITYDSEVCGATGENEIVIREFINYNEDKIATIYNGMPLRPEYRVFYNFKKHYVVDIVDYWDYNYVYENLYNYNDRIVFKATKKERKEEWNKYYNQIKETCESYLKNVNSFEEDINNNIIHEIWSIDFMVANDKIYLIDMALGYNSAYWKEKYLSKK